MFTKINKALFSESKFLLNMLLIKKILFVFLIKEKTLCVKLICVRIEIFSSKKKK